MGVAPYTTGPVITTGVAPHTAGGQASATQLNYGFSAILPVASWVHNASVQLPLAVAGQVVTIMIQEAGLDDWKTLAIFARKGSADTINGNANATQYDFVGTSTTALRPVAVMFMCHTTGAWITNITPRLIPVLSDFISIVSTPRGSIFPWPMIPLS